MHSSNSASNDRNKRRKIADHSSAKEAYTYPDVLAWFE